MGAAENAVQSACLRLLAHWPGVLVSGRTNNAATFDGKAWRKFTGIRGMADSLTWARPGALPRGTMAAVEFKAPGGKPSPEQVAFLRAVADSGHTAACVDSVGGLLAILEKRMEPSEDGVYYALAGKKSRKSVVK